MALRSVLLDSPSSGGPRRTVVVRTGGPAPKGHWADIAIGVLGAILLVAAVALAQLMPDRTYLNPQFRFTAVDVTVETGVAPPFYFEIAGERIHDYLFEVTDDNVKSIAIQAGFRDDISYSLPDRFQMDLYAPDGTFFGHATLENPPPQAGADTTENPTFKVATLATSFPIAPPVPDQILTGLTHRELPEQVLARMAPQVFFPSKGTWTLRVELLVAGNCPGPGEAVFASQPIDCRVKRPSDTEGQVASDGNDPGNIFIVTSFVYTYYVPQVEELK